MRRLLGLVAVACLLATGGCSRGGPDGLMRQQVALMHDLIDAMESGDEAKTESIRKESVELGYKFKELNLSPDEMKALMEKFKPEMDEAGRRMAEVMAKKFGNKMGNPFGKN